jgi:hypothetical protein
VPVEGYLAMIEAARRIRKEEERGNASNLPTQAGTMKAEDNNRGKKL